MIYSLRGRIGLILLLFLSIWTVVHPVEVRTFFHQKPIKNQDTKLVRQVSCLKEVLPVRGSIGYINKIDGSFDQTNNINEGYKHFLTEYALVPLILVRLKAGNLSEWIIANFPDSAGVNPKEIAGKLGLLLVKNCGGGTVLFRTRSGQ